MSIPEAPTAWHRLDLWLARLRPHREPLSLLVDGLVIDNPFRSVEEDSRRSNGASAHPDSSTRGHDIPAAICLLTTSGRTVCRKTSTAIR